MDDQKEQEIEFFDPSCITFYRTEIQEDAVRQKLSIPDGEWYIKMKIRPNFNTNLSKNQLKMKTLGHYLTERKAQQDLVRLRMAVEGYIHENGQWIPTESLKQFKQAMVLKNQIINNNQQTKKKPKVGDFKPLPNSDYIGILASEDKHYLQYISRQDSIIINKQKRQKRSSSPPPPYSIIRRDLMQEMDEEEDSDSDNDEGLISEINSVAWRGEHRKKLVKAILDDSMNDILLLDETLVALNSVINVHPIELSSKQNARLRIQAYSVLTLYEVMDEFDYSNKKTSSSVDNDGKTKSTSILECANIAAQRCLEKTSSTTIYSWHLQFIKNGGKFLPDGRAHRSNVGTFLDRNEDLKLIFKNWLKQNLRNLTSQKAQNFINLVMLPKHYFNTNGDEDPDDEEETGRVEGGQQRNTRGRNRNSVVDDTNDPSSSGAVRTDMEVYICRL